MTKPNYYKNLFLIGALWNLLIAVICSAGCIFLQTPFFKAFGIPLPSTLFPYVALFSVVLALGIGYYLVSMDISNNHGIITIGIIGKVLIFICCLSFFLLGDANSLLLVPGIGDLVFAILFLEFLIKGRFKLKTED
jgi:tryptophan-rich sensory protein